MTILNEEIMQPLGSKVANLAEHRHLPQAQINAVANQGHIITGETAACLAEFFKMEPQFWLPLRSEHELRAVHKKITQ